MLGSYKLDIFNAEKDKWDEATYKAFFRDRLEKMKPVRPDEAFDQYEEQTTAISFYDNEGLLQVNVPLEKTLGEIYMGKTKGKVRYDILPDGQADVEELQPSKYALEFFLDGNYKENFWKENKKMREYKHKYGEGIFYTGIRSYKDINYVPKEGVEFQSGTDLLQKSKFDKVEKETWFFFPKALHPKDFWIDDKATEQVDIQYAEDCIYKERVSAIELEMRYGKNTAFDQEQLQQVDYWTDPAPINSNSGTLDNREIILYHYFHRITKTYMVVANEQQVLYNGLYLYEDGKLPFVGIQHYSAIDRFRGEGIPERVAYLKAYKSEIFQDILTGSAMSSGINLLTGNDSQIGQDWNLGNRQVNIWRTTGDVEQVRPINTTPNLGYFTNVIQLIDKEITINSGINPAEQFEQTTDKLGIVEIQEANKLVRNASVDENYEIGLDEALTMTLSRIKQFAPSLLSEVIKNKKGKTLKTIFPKITIKGFKVERKGGKQRFVESLGKFGYFDLKPDIVQGVGVKVVTASTNSVTPILERQKITDYINNLFKLAEVASLDQSGEMLRKLSTFVRFEELMGWISDAYGYDVNGLKANTEKDDIAKENIDKIEALKKVLTTNTQENVGQVTETAAVGKVEAKVSGVEGGQEEAGANDLGFTA